MLVVRPVFFNLFAAAEPHTSVKVTRGTLCIDPWVQRRMRGWSYRVSTDSFFLAEQSPWEDDKASKDDQY